MSVCLGIHISDDAVGAAICAGDPDDVRAVPLGTSGVTTPAAVAAGADGAVLVGEGAVDATGPVVRDPLARAARGRTGALTAVITHVVGRAAVASRTGAPDKLAIVVPDDFVAVERDNVVAAANAAGYTDVTLVPASLAEARASGGADGAPLAFGAARIGLIDAPPPIVTREDLGHSVEPDDPAPAAPAAPAGPVSVFDEDPEPALPPVQQSPEPVAAQPPPVRPTTPAPAPAAMVSAPPLQPIPERSVPLAPILGLVAVALVALVAFLVLGGGDDGVDTAATTTTLTPTTDAPTTTVTETTSSTSTTTTTEAPDETTSTSSTSSTSSTTTTTTTVPVRVSFPGPVTLSESGLAVDTGVVVQFGQDEDLVLDEIAAVLGDPDSDSGATENDFCDGSSARFVRWGNLELVFTNAGLDPETPRRFTQWFADGHLDPTGLVTPEGLGVTATVGFLEVTFPTAFVLQPAFEDDIVGIFAITNPSTGAVLNGTTLGLDPNGAVQTLWAGDSCTRIFT